MTSLLVINDTHVGAIRTAGTTPVTALQLRDYILERLEALVANCGGGNLLINGDLFDTANISMRDLFLTYNILRKALRDGAVSQLILVPGNHDLSKNSTVFTSFDMLAKLLQEEFKPRVVVPRDGMVLGLGYYVIPHVANQDLFNLELERVPAGTKYLFLHCNFDNGFAAQSDHSLNLSREAVAKLPAGVTIILGHEHQMGELDYDGRKVLIVGNQVPSSVADCLGNNTKQALVIRDADVTSITVWEAADEFLQVDWREAADAVHAKQRFVRVIGEATAAEAADVVAAVSKLRKLSSALVITNGVKIEGMADQAELKVSLDQIKAFSVIEALLEILNADERVIVNKLLEKNNV